MRYDMKRPCDNCPFLKTGGIRLGKSRIREIVRTVTDSQGATFSCYATVDYNKLDEDEDTYTHHPTEDERHCAGGLIFAEKQKKASQMVRIAERLGLYDYKRLDQDAFPLVFDSLAQMLRTACR